LALEAMPLTDDLKRLAITLFDLRGAPKDVLQTLSGLDLPLAQQPIVQTLKTLVDLLEVSDRNHPNYHIPAFILDLSLIQTFDYYTGIVFEVINQTATGYNILAQGGRYDTLLSLYHPQGKGVPGIGFVLNMDDVQRLLAPRGQIPQATPATDWLVVPKSPSAAAAAFTYAQRIRSAANLVRVEVELQSADNMNTIRAQAKQRRIQQIAWVDEDGTPHIEAVH